MVNKMELLEQGVDFANELSPLDGAVSFHRIVRLQNITKVFNLPNPRKRKIIQKNWSNVLPVMKLLGEHNALCFRLDWIWISTELQVFAQSKSLTDSDHFLETSSAGRQQQQVISIPKTTIEVSANVAPHARSSETEDEPINVMRNIKMQDIYKS